MRLSSGILRPPSRKKDRKSKGDDERGHSSRYMTFAEIVLLITGGIGIYFLLRPLQRWLEIHLNRKFFAHHTRLPRRPTIDVTDFTSYPSHKKEDHHT